MSNSTPNILVFHCHDLGRYLGCYGRDIETPNIDAIAESGVLFENHYATAPQCSPSRGSRMTGRYPHANGLIGLAHDGWMLNADEVTLPAYLNKCGYETHLFGLQHVADDPGRLGFDRIHSGKSLSPAVLPTIQNVNRAHNVAASLENFFESGAFDAPIFISAGVFEAHRLKPADGSGFDDPNYVSDDPNTIDPPAFLPDKPVVRKELAAMHGMIRAVDDAVGTITSALKAAEIDEETLVVFTTEHGIAFPRAKGSCYDPGIEAALIMRYPGVIDDGVRCEELISNIDLVPTLLDLLEEPIPERVGGQSFLSLLTGETYHPREQLFAEITWHDHYVPVRAIRTTEYKYLRSFWHLPRVYIPNDVYTSAVGKELHDLQSGQRPYEELYDLNADPHEQTNLSEHPEYQHIRTRLRERLGHWMEQTDDPLLDGPVFPADYDEILPEHTS